MSEIDELEEGPSDDDDDEKCVLCGGPLDEQLTCGVCVTDIPEEDIDSALETVLQDVHVMDILYTIPGIYELVKEAYNNETLDQAYQDLVDKSDISPEEVKE